jgi:hypothetical protein
MDAFIGGVLFGAGSLALILYMAVSWHNHKKRWEK